MLLAMDFRRQARVCARLAEECDDRRLAERLRRMASDLLAKAEISKSFPPTASVTKITRGSCYLSAKDVHRGTAKRTRASPACFVAVNRL
jgi:hypothetical protein